MKITVCIPTFNQGAFIEKAVRSALNQQGTETEVWVADDASTDHTPAVMESFSSDPRVHYYRQPKNLGIAANAGWVLSQATTDFVVRLDSDDLLAPAYCSTLAGQLTAYPLAAVAHAAVQEIDEHSNKRRLRLLRRDSAYQDPDTALRAAASGYRVAANICMFRRAALETSGLIYRAGMNFCEDWDLFARLAASGWGNVYSDKVLASYRVWTDPGGYRAGRKLTELRGMRQVFEETLEPAFFSRGWSPKQICMARRNLACSQARALVDVPRLSEDYLAIEQELLSLGSCPGLRSRLWLIKRGLGFLLYVGNAFKLGIKDWIKLILRKAKI